MNKTASILFFICFVLSLVMCKSGAEKAPAIGQSADIEVPAFKALISKGNYQLVDVRTPAEYQEGHIENAVNIDILDQSFNNKLNALNKNKPVLVYCKKGGRSSRAKDSLVLYHFDEVYNLKGGYLAWTEAPIK